MKKILFFSMMILALCAAIDVEAKTKKFKNGDVYDGEMVKGIASGVGVMKYANGDIYNGCWSGGVQRGEGVMKYANGDIYNGSWSEGFAIGKGEMKFANGDVYNGSWSAGVQAGKGVMKYANGDLYNGSWLEGFANGKGEMKFANGDVYNGSWFAGVQTGQGMMTYANGDTYNGTWAYGKTKGVGTFYDKKARREYAGYWLSNGKIDTSKEVELIYIDGNKQGLDYYTGKIKNDMRNGFGTLVFKDKNKYTGHWIDDKIDESQDVEIEYADARKYIGRVTDGKLSSGKLTIRDYENCVKPENFVSIVQIINDAKVTATEIQYSDGSSYIGDHKDLNRDGHGTYYFNAKNGSRLELKGVWKEDFLVKGSGVIKGAKRGDRFYIESVDGAKARFYVYIYENGKEIFSRRFWDSLNEILSKHVCDVDFAIRDKSNNEFLEAMGRDIYQRKNGETMEETIDKIYKSFR